MADCLPPGATIGILGGGQLGRMLAIAAAQIGYRVHIYAPDAHSVAADVAAAHSVAAYDDERALAVFASHVDVVTFEWENVPCAALEFLAAHVPVRPGARALAIAQDRLLEKRFAHDHGVPVAPFAEVASEADLSAALARIGVPAILKTARDGYDGKGQARIHAQDEAVAAWRSIGQHRAILEAMVDFSAEFSVLLARGADGQSIVWDCPENEHRDGILARSIVPASPIIAAQVDTAVAHAHRLADALDYVGVLACEFFAGEQGPIFNEMAPRVHNSGHWTIEGAATSQFENHVRAVCGLPLGATTLRGASVEMRNLIGAEVDQWPSFFADADCHPHLYGKGHGRFGRKMGHVTWVHGP